MAAPAGKIRVHAVKAANEERGGPLEYYQLPPNDFGRPPVVDGAPGVLLAEALRFYNYGAGRPDFVVEKTDWLRIDSDTLPAAIDELVSGLTEAVVAMAHELAFIDRSGHVPYLPKCVLATWLAPDIDATIERIRAAYPAVYPRTAAVEPAPASLGGRLMATRLSVSANLGLLAGHVLFSPALRHPDRVAALRKPAGAAGVYFREFEQLPERLQKLRALVQAGRLEARLRNEPRCAFASAGGAAVDRVQSLFSPNLGGSWVIKPDALGVGRVLPHPPANVGATEKLYYSVASSAFASAHALVARGGGPPGRHGATLLREIVDGIESLQRVLPSAGSYANAMSRWTQWQRNIELLEDLFASALELRVERPYDMADDAGVRVGLPAAFILTGALRVYLADLMGRALMLALRQSIWRIYCDVNGYLGVLLWEILSGEDIVGIRHAGCRRILADGIQGKRLPVERFPWERAARNDSWLPADNTSQAAFDRLTAIAQRPLARSPGEPSRAPAVTFAGFKTASVPRTPPVAAAFATAVGVTRARAPDSLPNCDLLYGLQFTAQLQVYVAFRLVAQARAILGWDQGAYTTGEPRDPAQEGIVKRRTNANLLITAGSYLWGGYKPPHGSSHRDGASLDLVFGPNIFPWIRSRLSDALTKDDIAPFPELAGRSDLLVAVYTRDDADTAIANHTALKPDSPVFVTALEAMPLHDVVFHQLLRDDVVNPVIRRLSGLARANPLVYSWDEEEAAYRAAEESLAGTSHFIDTREAQGAGVPATETTELGDWQRTHAAHLAILAAGPESLIFASTLTHVRAMRALRATFCAAGIELFRLERTASLIEYLDDPGGRALPDVFAAALRGISIPVVRAPRIRAEVPGHDWRMTILDAEFVLTASDTEVRVAFLPPAGVRKAAADLVAGARFDPKPHDHHHHWHVRFHPDRAQGMQRIAAMRDLWLALAIDLEPFGTYLDRSFPPPMFGDALLREAAAEREEVRRFCADYGVAFRDRYGRASLDGAATAGSAESRTPTQRLHGALAQRLREALFKRFDAGSELVAPTIQYADYRAGRVGAELSAAIAKSRDIIQQLTRHWRREREKAEAFLDYREEFIQGLRDLTLPPVLEELKRLIYFHEPPKLSPESDSPP